MPPKRAIEILEKLAHDAGFLSGESFASPKRSEWTDTARGVLERAFPSGSSILSSFETAQSLSFGSEESEDRLREIANGVISSSVAVLRSAIVQLSWELEESEEAASVPISRTNAGPAVPVFISHSSKDAALAEALIDLMQAALGLVAAQIRCSSVDGYRLPVGVNTENKLREEVNAANIVIGLITPSSLTSSFVMFELGARWGSSLFLAPLLAGVKPSELAGPLSLLNALSADNQAHLHQLLGDVADHLHKPLGSPASYLKHVMKVVQLAGQVRGGRAETLAAVQAIRDVRVTFVVEGEPPMQAIKVTANRFVTVSRVEYMLSGGAVIASDNVLLRGERFEVPINRDLLTKVWNTPRADRNHSDHSGPANLGITLSGDGDSKEFVIPIYMQHTFVGNTVYVKVIGSKSFAASF